MNGSLKRALGLWAASQVEGLHVYADDLANAKHRYPCCTVSELTHGVGPLGCGKKDFTVRDSETGFVAISGKMHQAEENFRLTVSSPSEAQRHGQEIVDGILETLESAVLLTGLSSAPLVLVDSEATPPEPFKVEGFHAAGRQAIPPDATGEPFLYRGALTMRITRNVPVEEPVEHVIERIHVQGEPHVG